MKIVVAGQNYFINGGSDKAMLDHIGLLEDFGHDVAPFCGRSERNIKSHWEKYFVEASDFDRANISDILNYIYSHDAKRKISGLFNDFNPDIFHCHIYYGKLTGSIINEIIRRNIPFIQTLHEYKIVCPVSTAYRNGSVCYDCSGFNFSNVVINRCNRGSLSRSFLSFVESTASYILGSVEKVGHFISVSDFLRDEIIKRGVPDNKITTIHNFIDVDKYTISTAKRSYFSYVGRVERDKGIWVAIEAFSRMKEERLVIVGSGSQLNDIIKYIQDNSIKNIEAVGFKSGTELNNIISESLAVVVPSICLETFGLSIIEAHAMGVPVIASRIGGIVEVVSDNINGYLIDPGSVDQLIERVRFFSRNTDISVSMGMHGREDVKVKFDKGVHYNKLMSLYNNLLN